MPIPSVDNYERRAEATFARRLMNKLIELNIISELTKVQLLFPDWEDIEAAEKE